MNERRATARSRAFPVGRRRLLRSMGGAAAATALLGRHVPAATPADSPALIAGAAPVSRNQATAGATPDTGTRSTPAEPPDIIAINFLLEPDASLAEVARAVNARLREAYSAGYPLDESHVPHVTVVQRFVRATDLGSVAAAVSEVLDAARPLGWPLRATGYDYVVLAGLAVMIINIERTAELERLQQEAIEAIAPFTVDRGTEAAFVPSLSFDPGIIDYVATFVPKASGQNYSPHVTVGVAGEDVVKRLKAEPYDPFTAQVAGAAIYQLGIHGTAAKRLWGWTPR